MGNEKRKHIRHEILVTAEISLEGRVLNARTRNLSSGGVAVVLGESVEEGTILQVSLFLTHDGFEDPDEDALIAEASVMWSAEQEDGRCAAGLRFEKIAPAQVARLGRFIAAISEDD